MDEVDESVIVSGSSGTLSIDSTKIRLTDDDATPSGIRLSVSPATVAEDVATAPTITVTARVNGRSTYATDTDVTVSVAGSGTASAVDFAPVDDFTITIPADTDSATGTFTLTPDNDDAEETDETVTVSGSSGSLRIGRATIRLIDDEMAAVASRRNRVNEEIAPQAAQSIASSTLSAITGRIDAAVSGAVSGGSLNLAGRTSLYRALKSNERALEDGTLSLAEVLGGSSFVLPLTPAGAAGAAGPDGTAGGKAGGKNSRSGLDSLALWGSGDYRKLSQDGDGTVDWDGDIFSFHLGADMRVRPDLLAGLAVSRSLGSFDYTDRTDPVAEDGRYKTWMTGVHAYVHGSLSDDLGLWATVGYGLGEIEIDDEANAKASSDTAMWTAALGARGTLVSDDEIVPGGETTLKLKGETSLARFSVEGGGEIDASTSDIYRLRLILEAGHERRLDSGGRLTPSVEVGLRYDGGDGATGAGLELGGALRYVDPAMGLTAEGRGRILLARGDGYREWGLGGLVRFDPGAAKRGLSFSLTPAWGDAASGTARLWDRGMAGTEASDGKAPQMRLDGELGYGFGAYGGRGLLTPYGGFSLAGAGARSYRIGGRFEAGPSLALNLEGERREPAGDAAADYRVLLRLNARW